MSKSSANIIRQGDVLLVPVAARKRGRKPDSEIVLMHGEVTGHAHRIAEHEHMEIRDEGAQRFIRALKRATLTHEEHHPAILVAGVTYQQAFQVEDWGPVVEHKPPPQAVRD